MCLFLSVCLPTCLSTCSSTYLSTYLFTYSSTLLSPWLSSCLLTCLPSCVPASLPSLLHTCCIHDVPSVLRCPKGTVKEASVKEASMTGHGTRHLPSSPHYRIQLGDVDSQTNSRSWTFMRNKLKHESRLLPLVRLNCVCACARLHYCNAACLC